MRLLFINRFYWPETPATGQLLTDLAEALAADGHDVSVITSAAHAGIPDRESRRGVAIYRIRGTRWAGGGIAGKAADFGTFLAGALWQAGRLARRGTIVVAMTDPPLLGIGAQAIAGPRGARLVHWVQDIYPEIAVALTGHTWLQLLAPWRNRAWRHADACVTLGHDMAQLIAGAGVGERDIAIIPNWAPLGVAALDSTSARVPGAPFVVGYSGNLGRVHDLEPVLAVAELLRDERSIAFTFAGDGAQRPLLEAAARQRGLANVTFHPARPRDDLARSLAAADLHLVTLRPGCERFVFPSKLYGVTAVGRPVLYIGPRHSEVAQLVVQHDLGFAAERDAVADIAGFIRRLAQDRATWLRHAKAARDFAARHSAPQAIEQWRRVLAAVGACRPIAAAAHTGSI